MDKRQPRPLSQLKLVQLTHYGFDHKVHEGQLVVHARVAEEVVAIFHELFEAKYPIEKMHLIDEYDADDEKSCADNNTSAFCSRPITGTQNEWSQHSYGLAIDINPKYNPYCKGNKIVPENGKAYLDRTLCQKGLITKNDLCYQCFSKYGWKWGGDWIDSRGYVDYQHFYKPLPETTLA